MALLTLPHYTSQLTATVFIVDFLRCRLYGICRQHALVASLCTLRYIQCWILVEEVCRLFGRQRNQHISRRFVSELVHTFKLSVVISDGITGKSSTLGLCVIPKVTHTTMSSFLTSSFLLA